jgi:hypothetical protein
MPRLVQRTNRFQVQGQRPSVSGAPLTPEQQAMMQQTNGMMASPGGNGGGTGPVSSAGRGGGVSTSAPTIQSV